MLQDNAKRKKLLGGIIAASVFVLWIIVDLYIFPLFGLTSYSLYEILAYGSWTIITLICFGILVWAGWFPMRRQSSDDNESPDLVG
jgi:hypothetical protein